MYLIYFFKMHQQLPAFAMDIYLKAPICILGEGGGWRWEGMSTFPIFSMECI